MRTIKRTNENKKTLGSSCERTKRRNNNNGLCRKSDDDNNNVSNNIKLV